MDDFERKGIANEKAWLLRIAINTCKDYRRTAWFRHVDRSKALDELPPQLIAVEPEDRTLTLMVMDLPDRYKQVILLHFFQGLTMQETADALGASQSTVHRRLKKAEERTLFFWHLPLQIRCLSRLACLCRLQTCHPEYNKENTRLSSRMGFRPLHQS